MRLSAFPKFKTIIKVAGLVVACALAQIPFYSCSEEGALTAADLNAREVTISFNLLINSNTDTRAGRQLWSRAPRQQVNDMKLLLFKGTGENALYYKTVDVAEFLNSSPNFTETESVSITETLEEGTYSFLAVGFESDIEDGKVKKNETYTLENREGESRTSTLTPGVSTLKDMSLAINDGKIADEVFAGLKEGITINEDSKVVNGGYIRLNRVTAGILGYFKNIPFQLPNAEGELIQVTRVAVVASVKGLKASLISPFKCREQQSSIYELLSFDLSSYSQDEGNNWYAIPAFDWKAEGLAEAPKGVKKQRNSVLGGRFILPANAESSPTLQVVLYGGEGGSEILRTYDVACADHIENEDSPSDMAHADRRLFDILANHYYALGVKYTDSGEDPKDEDHPEPFKPDDPIDLSKEQIITITVSPLWDERHDMTL